MITIDQIKDLHERIGKLRTYLDIDKKRIEISNEEEKTTNPDFWNNPKEAEAFMKVLRSKKKWVEDFEKVIVLNNDLTVLYEFLKEGEATEQEVDSYFNKTEALLDEIEFRNMLSEEGDNLSAVLQITAGAGGELRRSSRRAGHATPPRARCDPAFRSCA